MTSFLAELRRRSVLKVALAYLAIGWLVISIGDIFLPLINAPDWVFKVLLSVIALGLPTVIMFSWIFEITPEGIKRESELSDDVGTKHGRKFNLITISVLVAALGVSVYLNIFGANHAVNSAADATEIPSIAVLPFSNRSHNPENALFVDGIHDDLLTNLAHIGSLKVISRTSVMEYRDTTKNIRQIAAELGVTTVLEGAVQRSGDTVHINVQLIDANTDAHLWAKSYDRELTTRNIFQIQSEIAKQISNSLKAALTPTEEHRLDSIPTENLEAYNLYRLGRHNLEERELETAQLARTQFEQAIRLDADYSDAYSGLADSILLLRINHKAISRDETYRLSRDYLAKALMLDPENADAYASLGLLKLDIWKQTHSAPEIREAEAAFEKALELNPNHARAIMWYASLKGSEKKLDEAIALYRKSLELDPLARIPYANLPGMYAAKGLNQEALDQWLDAVRLHPGWPTPYRNISEHMQGLGRYDESIAWAMKAQELDSDPMTSLQALTAYIVFQESERVLGFMKNFPIDHPFAVLESLFTNFVLGNRTDVISDMENLLNAEVELPPFAYDIASDTALLIDDLDLSLKYLTLKHPALLGEQDYVVDPFKVNDSIKVAYIKKRKGEQAAAMELLEASLNALKDRPRLGAAGHGIRDVQILALMDQPKKALGHLRKAIDAGFRSDRSYDNWGLLEDPYLESVRTNPEFLAMYEEAQGKIAKMHQSATDAEESGNWDELRALASTMPVNPDANLGLRF